MISFKKNKIFLIFILFAFGFAFKLSPDILSPCRSSDECGKIVGWIVDSETKDLVKDEFAVSIYPYYSGMKYYPHDYYLLKTKSGHFSISVKPGKYFMIFTPWSGKPKYPYFFDPYQIPGEDQVITVEIGKITEFRKKLVEGGSLKVILVDPNGQEINFREYFKNGGVYVYLSNDDIGYGEGKYMSKEEIEAGEMIIGPLFAGIYRITAHFPESGYGKLKEESISIEIKKTTEYKIIIDPSNNTGIHGYIKDKNGLNLKNTDIFLFKYIKNSSEDFFATAIADENGYYKIFGIDEGIYSLRIETYIKVLYLHNIKITKNKLLLKDIEVDQ